MRRAALARSDLVIMREKFVEVVAENQRLLKELDEKGGQLAAANNRIAELEAKGEEDQAGHAAEIKSMEAVHASEIAERDERIKSLEADNAALAGDNKRLAASDACHNSPHSPPCSGTWQPSTTGKRRSMRYTHGSPTGGPGQGRGPPRRDTQAGDEQARRAPPPVRVRQVPRPQPVGSAHVRQAGRRHRKDNRVAQERRNARHAMQRLRGAGRHAALRDAEEDVGEPADSGALLEHPVWHPL